MTKRITQNFFFGLALAFILRAPSANAAFYFAPAVKLAKAEFSSSQSTFETRDMLKFGAEAMAGYQFGSILVAARAEYSIFAQLKSTSELNGTNLEGKSPQVGLAIGWMLSRAQLLGTYDFTSTYDADQKTITGNAISYSQPTIFGASLRISFTPKLWIGLDYVSASYGEKTVGSSTFTNDKLNYSSLGLSIGTAW